MTPPRMPWWLPMLLGLACVASVPTGGLVGVVLALNGIALLWLGRSKKRSNR